ncbi:hypothetical protein [Streptomyces sp. AK08-02]|uniref:hypothetical protein n=1 Tax=Streptomyces sp. AK08-02 TaxID=3028654 RepID=UPI0029A53717|nr:hypothetical protein [Streptomyces sp. AK08-02]MDX3748702.1 hypothetical protein [Streptomyces sp. AK08-02]
MTAVDPHAEAHRLRAELGYGARRIAGRLGISRYAAEQLLDKPLPAPVAEVADTSAEPVAEVVGQERPVAERGAEVAGPVADPDGQQVSVVAVPSAPVRRVAGVAALVFRPVAGVPSAAAVPWLQVELGGRPWLLRELRRLAWWGLRLPTVVDLAVRSFAAAYHQAITTGQLQPGQPYEVQTHIRPCQYPAAV